MRPFQVSLLILTFFCDTLVVALVRARASIVSSVSAEDAPLSTEVEDHVVTELTALSDNVVVAASLDDGAASAIVKGRTGIRTHGSSLLADSTSRQGNVTAALLNEFGSLRTQVSKEWNSWQRLSAEVWPKVDQLGADEAEASKFFSSARELRLPSVVELCARLSSCDLCGSSPVCGWCAASLRCVPGTPEAPAETSLCATSSADYSFDGCPGSSCEAHASCERCAQDGLCGWCGATGRCMEGSEWGPKTKGLPGKPCDTGAPVSHVQAGWDAEQTQRCGDPHTWVHHDAPRHSCALPSRVTTEVDFLSPPNAL